MDFTERFVGPDHQLIIVNCQQKMNIAYWLLNALWGVITLSQQSVANR